MILGGGTKSIGSISNEALRADSKASTAFRWAVSSFVSLSLSFLRGIFLRLSLKSWICSLDGLRYTWVVCFFLRPRVEDFFLGVCFFGFFFGVCSSSSSSSFRLRLLGTRGLDFPTSETQIILLNKFTFCCFSAS